MIPGLSRSSNPSAAGSGGFGGFVGGDADPLEGSRDSGLVGGPGALSSEKAIDQGLLIFFVRFGESIAHMNDFDVWCEILKESIDSSTNPSV